jgi:hypothetical protein
MLPYPPNLTLTSVATSKSSFKNKQTDILEARFEDGFVLLTK